MSAPRRGADRLTIEARAADALATIALGDGEPVVVAVSGGGDSMALLHLLHRHIAGKGLDMPLIAATIDHRLRAESAAEARAVGVACASLGIDHHVLHWSDDAGGPGVQARARAARHDLLSGMARDVGARIVLTGHTADDQAETVAMRRARSRTGRGLAGIDVASLYRRTIWFARPFLGMGRMDLRKWLAGERIDHVEDPSNRDMRFERVRVRAAMADDAAAHRELIGLARETWRARRSFASSGATCLDDRQTWRWLENAVAFEARGGQARHRAVSLRSAMAGVLTRIGRLPRMASDGRSQAALDFALHAPNGAAYTVAGCRLAKSGDIATITPEARNRRAPTHSCFDRLLPFADLELAQAVMRLTGAPPLPAAPIGLDGAVHHKHAHWSQFRDLGLAKPCLQPIFAASLQKRA